MRGFGGRGAARGHGIGRGAVVAACALAALSQAPAASGHPVPGPAHTGPAGAGVHSLTVRSGVDPTTPAWVPISNSAYAPALPGTGYIMPPGGCGTGSEPNGSPHTVTAGFTLPPGAFLSSIVVQVHADNAVAVRLNGQLIGSELIGGQSPKDIRENFQGPPESYTSAGTLMPVSNTLEFTLRNYIGPCALDYLAMVRFTFFNCPFGGGGLIVGNGTINGTPGGDIITGGPGPDVINGGGGGDIINGDAGDDCIVGDDGDDDLFGGPGNDTLLGAVGSDDLFGGLGDDAVDGGDGPDQAHGDAGADIVHGGADVDSLHGDASDDVVSGDAGNDTLTGGADNDALSGGPDVDVLDDAAGGSDRDTLNGGDGADTLLAFDSDGLDTLWGPETPLVAGGLTPGYQAPRRSTPTTSASPTSYSSQTTTMSPASAARSLRLIGLADLTAPCP
ncbi:MAG: calcium-binding protein [Pseudonocardiaceae bacterium]